MKLERLNPYENKRELVLRHILSMEEIMLRSGLQIPIFPIKTAENLWRYRLIGSLAEFELGLRETQSKIYLVSNPPVFDEKIITAFPVARNKRPEFSLFVAMNGEKEALNILQQLELTRDENLVRLRTTCIMYQKEPGFTDSLQLH